MKDEQLKKFFSECRVIAVVGLSRDPKKDSFRVSSYMKHQGFRIIPINPYSDEILNEKSYQNLLDIPANLQQIIDIVDIFRPSAEVLAIVKEAIELKNKNNKPSVVWMQIGIADEKAAIMAETAGLRIVMNKCIMVEHRRLS